jgi:hypothetical protein
MAKATSKTKSKAHTLRTREESRSLSASRARQTAAGMKKRGTPFGMTRVLPARHRERETCTSAAEAALTLLRLRRG